MISKQNLKYFTASIIFAVLLLIAGIFGVYYFFVFIHSNSIAYQITSFALAAMGAYILYNRMKKRKQRNLQKIK